jgi:uncharacterized protein (DUF58 family)
MAPTATKPDLLLDPDTIARAEALGLHSRLIVEGYIVGEHRSPFHGFSVEFAQHREYVPGDDLRHLDWKVLSRTDRYYVKQYEQETNFVANLLLDGSESMNYGSGKITKLHYGKALAACLTYLVLHQRDAVALDVVNDITRARVPRTNSMGAIRNVMNTLSAFEARGAANLGPTLSELASQVRRRGIVIIISDLLDDEEALLKGIQHLRFNGHEVIVFHVLDPHEIEFPFAGNVEFIGLENLPMLRTRPEEIRRSYRQAVEEFCGRIRLGCQNQDCHYVLANTGQRLPELLASYLAFRQRTAR